MYGTILGLQGNTKPGRMHPQPVLPISGLAEPGEEHSPMVGTIWYSCSQRHVCLSALCTLLGHLEVVLGLRGTLQQLELFCGCRIVLAADVSPRCPVHSCN